MFFEHGHRTKIIWTEKISDYKIVQIVSEENLIGANADVFVLVKGNDGEVIEKRPLVLAADMTLDFTDLFHSAKYDAKADALNIQYGNRGPRIDMTIALSHPFNGAGELRMLLEKAPWPKTN